MSHPPNSVESIDGDFERLKIQLNNDLNAMVERGDDYKCKRCGEAFVVTIMSRIGACITNNISDLLNKYLTRAKVLLDIKLQQFLDHSRYVISSYEDDAMATDEILNNPDRRLDEFDLDEFMEVSDSTHLALKYLFNHTYADELIPFDRQMLHIDDTATLIVLLKKCNISKEDMELVLEHIPDFIERFS